MNSERYVRHVWDLTRKYPKVQDVDNIDIIFASCPSPNTAPTTTGMRLKKPPEPIPLIIAKKIRSPREDANGQRAIALTPITVSERIMLLTGPRKISAPKPIPIRPRAEAKFHAASIDAATRLEKPIDEM